MDQAKIGRFIAECRKGVGLTQLQLAEKLNITDRAVSKWETGKAMPDSSIMLELCGILHITVNDLLSGEVVTMDHYNEASEKNLLEMVKQKEAADKRLLATEISLGIPMMALCFALLGIAAYANVPDGIRILLIVLSLAFVFVMCFIFIRIEQVAGYYECAKCGHRYVPTYNSVLWAMHSGRTRYMKCPECNKWSWNKKVLTKE